MHTQDFRKISTQKQQDEDNTDQPLAQQFFFVVHTPNEREERTQDTKGQSHIEKQEKKIEERTGNASALGYGHNSGQHEPCHNIPGSGGIKSQLPKIGTAHIALLHDARQHGKGCNTHRNTDKKSQGEEGNFGSVALISHDAQ